LRSTRDATRWFVGWITHVKNIWNKIIHVLIKTYKQISDNEEITFMSISQLICRCNKLCYPLSYFLHVVVTDFWIYYRKYKLNLQSFSKHKNESRINKMTHGNDMQKELCLMLTNNWMKNYNHGSKIISYLPGIKNKPWWRKIVNLDKKEIKFHYS
jgi:hypothetical protein